ncbi:K+-transporting ATPase ATPase C chain [Sanguibacter gelidistatuariae]|uniref:Potassium-transporting ATPase KdpC subunit n=1 Tax=Sanguibacter gelidistatuariae TaxID=1814289 RepID=A0A1G6L5W5_9MICO|nr:potassium-transporting ATPase subunit KdpC [Sanguibacter gelidistatuariae]SDC38680.1 K+-transporting ATPase ATPase C chain [Sanguibacter gelidistatuariae]
MAHDNNSSVHPAGQRSLGLRRGSVSLARQTLAGFRVLLVLTVLLGVIYPVAVFAVGQVGLRWQANGSLLLADGSHADTRSTGAGTDNAVVGSALIGQQFTGDEWFHPRPSAAGDGYDTLASAGSNLGPLNLDLVATIEERRAEVSAADGTVAGDVPPDALTASASGLDPHISPAYAAQQAERVATARGLDQAAVTALVAEHTAGRDLGVLGEPRVNVLELNLALEKMSS